MPTGNASYDPQAMAFSAETVAVLLLGSKISSRQYAIMSALDGERTANSFQHQFRSVLKRATELAIEDANKKARGEEWDDVKPFTNKKRSLSDSASNSPAKSPNTPKKPRTKGPKATPTKTGASSSANSDSTPSPSEKPTRPVIKQEPGL